MADLKKIHGFSANGDLSTGAQAWWSATLTTIIAPLQRAFDTQSADIATLYRALDTEKARGDKQDQQIAALQSRLP